MFENLSISPVPAIDAIDPNEFMERYLHPAQPVILNSLMAQWPATQKWSIEFLQSEFGHLEVPVYSSKPAQGKQHQHAAEQHLELSKYLNMLKSGENDLRIFFYNILQNAPELLQDFEYPELGMEFFKRLPVLFMGGKDTRVQMHFDIDLANLILCHFGGPKTVLLFAPDQSRFLYRVPYSFSALHSIDFTNPDLEQYPALAHAKGYVAHIEHGQALFIPSGFWHFIVYEDIGFSMTLRSLPTDLSSRLQLLRNIVVTRTVEGIMRKTIGQRWNDRNERLAVERAELSI